MQPLAHSLYEDCRSILKARIEAIRSYLNQHPTDSKAHGDLDTNMSMLRELGCGASGVVTASDEYYKHMVLQLLGSCSREKGFYYTEYLVLPRLRTLVFMELIPKSRQ